MVEQSGARRQHPLRFAEHIWRDVRDFYPGLGGHHAVTNSHLRVFQIAQNLLRRNAAAVNRSKPAFMLLIIFSSR